MNKNAVISVDGLYRYRLFRGWGESFRDFVLWIMLNPSTADADVDDPTIRRCIAFSKAFGFSGMWVGNLYARRGPDPSVLWALAASDARGVANAAHLQDMAARCSEVVCAWGVPGGRGLPVSLKGLELPVLQCLGKTKHGAPKHPLYVPRSAQLEPYP